MRCDKILDNSEHIENRHMNSIILICEVIVYGLNGIMSQCLPSIFLELCHFLFP